MSKTDVQLAMEHVCSKTETAGYAAYPDTIPERVADGAVVFRVFFTNLLAPLDYSFGGDYDWSDCGIEVEAAAVGADSTYTTLWAAVAVVQAALQNTSATSTDGVIHDCALWMPFQQRDSEPGSAILRAGATYSVKAKAT